MNNNDSNVNKINDIDQIHLLVNEYSEQIMTNIFEFTDKKGSLLLINDDQLIMLDIDTRIVTINKHLQQIKGILSMDVLQELLKLLSLKQY